MKNNHISVLITNYNKSKFLKNSLKSVLNQKYKNFEVIIFDDVSTDNSVKIIKKFKKIKLIINKLFEINKYFENNKKKKVLYNLPIVAAQNSFKFSKISKNRVWPITFPTSCISIKRDFLKLFFQNVVLKKYQNLEIDARINIFFNFYLSEYNVLKKKLTIYNHDYFGITSKIPKYSKKWWLRRSEAFDYLKIICLKKKIFFRINIDYVFTKIMSFIFKF